MGMRLFLCTLVLCPFASACHSGWSRHPPTFTALSLCAYSFAPYTYGIPIPVVPMVPMGIPLRFWGRGAACTTPSPLKQSFQLGHHWNSIQLADLGCWGEAQLAPLRIG